MCIQLITKSQIHQVKLNRKKEETEKTTIISGDFNTPLWELIEQVDRKICPNTKDFNNNLSSFDFMHKTLYHTTVEYTQFFIFF